MGLADRIADALDIFSQVLSAIKDGLEDVVFDPFAGAVSEGLAGAIWLITYTPAPQPSNGYIFGRPTNGFWGDIYDFYWGEALPLGILILFLSYFVTQAAATWGLAGEQRTRGMKKNLLNGLFILPGGWYLSVLLLQFSQALTDYFAPKPSDIVDIIGELMVGGIFGGGILLAVGGSLNLSFFALAILINLLRLFAIVMIIGSLPIFLGFSYGKVPILNNLGSGLYSSLPTLAFMSLPTAIAVKMSTWMLKSGGSLNIPSTPGPVSKLVTPLIMLVPAIFGIVIPVLMYNMKLYQVGGMAAGRAFGATSSPVGQASGSASERSIGKAQDLGGSAKELGGKATEMAGEAKSAINEMEIESGARTEDRLDWGEGSEEMSELNEGSYLKNRPGEDERSEELLPENDEYFENTDSEAQKGAYYTDETVTPDPQYNENYSGGSDSDEMDPEEIVDETEFEFADGDEPEEAEENEKGELGQILDDWEDEIDELTTEEDAIDKEKLTQSDEREQLEGFEHLTRGQSGGQAAAEESTNTKNVEEGGGKATKSIPGEGTPDSPVKKLYANEKGERDEMEPKVIESSAEAIAEDIDENFENPSSNQIQNAIDERVEQDLGDKKAEKMGAQHAVMEKYDEMSSDVVRGGSDFEMTNFSPENSEQTQSDTTTSTVSDREANRDGDYEVF